MLQKIAGLRNLAQPSSLQSVPEGFEGEHALFLSNNVLSQARNENVLAFYSTRTTKRSCKSPRPLCVLWGDILRVSPKRRLQVVELNPNSVCLLLARGIQFPCFVGKGGNKRAWFQDICVQYLICTTPPLKAFSTYCTYMILSTDWGGKWISFFCGRSKR